jgi:acyl-CoA thioesterase-1
MKFNVVKSASWLMRVLTLVMVLSSVFVVVAADDAHALKPKKKKIIANMVFIGDDIISGQGILNPQDSFMSKFKAMVAEDNLLPVQVYDFARPGETADSVVLHMKEILATRPDFAIVAIGYNDAMQKTDTDIFYNSMDSILNELYNAGVYVMIVSVPAPTALEDSYEAEFNQVFPKLAERYHTYHISDMMDGIYGNRHLTQIDLLHPNKEGVDAMMKKFSPVVHQMLKLYKDSISHCKYMPDDPKCAVDAPYAPETSTTAPAGAAVGVPVPAAGAAPAAATTPAATAPVTPAAASSVATPTAPVAPVAPTATVPTATAPVAPAVVTPAQ